ncbi:MAG: hypothetical protein U0441_00210 [Polyangiaceae bacterium]
MKTRSLTGLLVALCLLAGVAHGEPSAADKETARALLIRGRAKLDGKDYDGALKDLKGAHAIMNVPTTGVSLAKALAAVGQLIEARDTALAVARSTAEKGESPAFADARVEAAELASRIAPRIPSVTVTVSGPESATVQAKLNEVMLAPATLGLPRKVNPGRHVLVVSAPGFVARTVTIDVKEQSSLDVPIALERSASAPPPTATVEPTAPPTVTAPPSATETTTAPSASGSAAAPPASAPIPVWTWVVGGAGLVAAGVAAGFFVDHLGARDRVAQDCPNDVCDPSKLDATSAQALRAQWNRDLGLAIGFGALGLAGIGVGVAGIALRPGSAAPKAAILLRGPGVTIEGAF